MSLSDALIRQLALRAGVSPSWSDMQGTEHEVSVEGLRAVLAALGYPCASDAQTRNSLAALDAGVGPTSAQARFLTARVGEPVALPYGAAKPGRLEIANEDGERRAVELIDGVEGGLALPGFDRPGYHKAHLRGGDFTIATAPRRGVMFHDLSGGRAGFGLAAQIYSLGAGVECGVGDFGGVAAMAKETARRGADFLAISPSHALLGAPERLDSPYTPSSREFLDPVYADPILALTRDLAHKAGAARAEAKNPIDWRAARRAKAALLEFVHEAFQASASPQKAEFAAFRAAASPSLKTYALFEAIRAERAPVWDWRRWPAEFRSPHAPGSQRFARERTAAIDYQIFLQWLTQRSLRAAHGRGRDAGMTVGLIADIATGLDPAGADAWARPEALLQGLTVGAPPDPYTPPGQDWRLTTFSPQGLAASGYEPFIAMVRACLAEVGGLRLDHAMGLQRLYLIPEGLGPKQGTYVRYPNETLFRLVALEAWRRRAVVIGEDLGTYPHGFREYLIEQGVAGMRMLRIQRDGETGPWLQASDWTPEAAALTATHDIMSTAGWWKGCDLPDAEDKRAEREAERGLIWKAFAEAGACEGDPPPASEPARAVDAAFGFVGATPCQMKLATLEDALAVEIQPNVPGTTTEKPNWRHRFLEPAEAMIGRPEVEARMKTLRGQ